MEEVLFLRGRGVRGGGISAATLPLHLGEEHREPREDPARNKGRNATGPRGTSRLVNVLLCSSSFVEHNDSGVELRTLD